MTNTQNLVDAQWLSQQLTRNNSLQPVDATIVPVDASWYLPQQKRNGREEYEAQHIPGALFFDIDAHSDQNSDLPHMLPNVSEFETAMSKLGIRNDHHLVIYDGLGIFSAPRVWWTLKVFGHQKVSVLNGGLPAWLRRDLPTEAGSISLPTSEYKAGFNEDLVSDWQDVLQWSDSGNRQIIDARAQERFMGQAAEPRAGLASGHITGSKNLPFQELLSDSTFRDPSELQAAFENAGVDLSAPIVTSCGSGVTASILTLALAEIGHTDTKLYDGSWSEWGMLAETAEHISKG